MGIPIATVKSGRQAMPGHIELLTLEVRRELNRVPEATMTLLDGGVATGRFEVSNLSFFAPGSPVSIALRYAEEQRDTLVFEGVVVRHAVEAGEDGSHLRVELKDRAFRLTRTRRTRVHPDVTDAKVIGDLAREAGLTTGTIAATTPCHAALLQYNATDWDFLVSRADVVGLVVDVHLGALTATPLALGAPKLTLDHARGELSEISLELDGASQWEAVEALGWSSRDGAITTEAGRPPATSAGNVDPESVASALGAAKETLLHPAEFVDGELAAWATARMTRSRYAFLRGRAVVPGNATLEPLDAVVVRGVGDRFDGKVLVSGVVHRLDGEGWQTELLLGLSPEWFARTPDIADVPAGGLLPPARGLQVAIVGAVEQDPTGELRVRVKLPALPSDQGDVWARLASPDAGAKRGFVFRPELGDEVVLGFLDDDPRQPVVLGALFGSRNAPPKPVEEQAPDNAVRAIVSRAGTRIVFDDSKPSLVLETTAGGNADGTYTNRIVIDEGARSITIEDQHGNSIKMEARGVTLQSCGDVTIDATGKVAIRGATVDLQ